MKQRDSCDTLPYIDRIGFLQFTRKWDSRYRTWTETRRWLRLVCSSEMATRACFEANLEVGINRLGDR